jgi:cytochrome c-type biogenesis protein CcmH/NrfF
VPRPIVRSVAALLWLVSSAAFAADDDHGSAANAYSAPDDSFDDPVEGASRLEGRLLAPCCWDTSRQTLDIHGSPVANQLRREIRSRLRAGETAAAIEADLVRRYSTKILAVPPGNPLKEVGIFLSVGLVLAGAGIGSVLWKWKRRSTPDAPPAPRTESDVRDPWDDELEKELEKID